VGKSAAWRSHARLVAQPDLLPLDEPTNHLDAESILWLEHRLRDDFKGAALSSRTTATSSTASPPASSRSTTRASTATRATTPRIWKARPCATASKPGRAPPPILPTACELEFVRAGVRAQRSKARTRLDEFDARVLAGRAGGRAGDGLDHPPATPLANAIIDTTDLGACVNDRWSFSHLDLSFEAGDCVGVIGRNGLGKTTLLRTLMGERCPDEGTRHHRQAHLFDYVDQQRLLLDPEKSVMEEVAGNCDFVSFGDEQLHVRTYLRRSSSADERVTMRVKELSGGERKAASCSPRSCVAAATSSSSTSPPTTWTCKPCACWRKPSSPTTAASSSSAMTVTSSTACATASSPLKAMAAFVCARQLQLLPGERAAVANAEVKAVNAPVAKEPETVAAEKPREFSMKEQRELAEVEARIATLEAELAEMDANLANGEFFA